MYFQAHRLVQLVLILLPQYLRLPHFATCKQRSGSARTNIAHDQWRVEQQNFTASLVAHTHTRYLPVCLYNLLNLSGEQNFSALRPHVCLQFSRQRATATLDDSGCAEAKHILGSTHHLRRADLMQFQAECEARDTLKKGYQLGVALDIDVTFQPESKRPLLLLRRDRAQKHQ